MVSLSILLPIYGTDDNGVAAQAPGSDGTSRMKSQLYILGNEGGGYVEWWVEGKIASAIRRLIDSNESGFSGNADGTLQGSEKKGASDMGEVHNFIEHLENKVLENHVFRGAIVKRADCESTSGFTGSSVNSTKQLYIHITFSAEFNVPKRQVELNGNPFLEWVLVDELLDENVSYDVRSDEEHISIVLGFGTIYDPVINSGSMAKYRVGIGEIITYTSSYSTKTWTDDTRGVARDTARYEGFYWLESPLELVLIVLVLGYVTVSNPKWRMLKEEREKIKWLHYLAIGLVIMCALAYVFNAPGLVVIILSVAVCFAIYVLSKGIYKLGWGNISRPKYRMLEAAKGEKKVRCQNCNTTFVVKASSRKVKCPSCNNEGKLE